MSKRLATQEEIDEAIALQVRTFPKLDNAYFEAKLKVAEELGYMNETCHCGSTFLAFHHFARCSSDGCPMRSGNNLIEALEIGETS